MPTEPELLIEVEKRLVASFPLSAFDEPTLQKLRRGEITVELERQLFDCGPEWLERRQTRGCSGRPCGRPGRSEPPREVEARSVMKSVTRNLADEA